MGKNLLTKDQILYDRDEKGELIGREVELEIDETKDQQLPYKGMTAVVKPIPRGAIKRLFSDEVFNDKERDLDAEIIQEYVINPKLSKEDVTFLKPAFAVILVNTVLRESGIVNKPKYSNKSETSGANNNREVVDAVEDDFAKN